MCWIDNKWLNVSVAKCELLFQLLCWVLWEDGRHFKIPSAIYFDLILCLEFSMFSLVRNNLFDLRRCQCEAERIRQNVPECTWVVDRAFFLRSSNRSEADTYFFLIKRTKIKTNKKERRGRSQSSML